MPNTNTKNRTKTDPRELVAGFLAGLLGGILTWIVTDYLSVKQEQVLLSSITVDSVESRQGKESLRWDFTLQPTRRYLFSPTDTIGGLFHLEIQPNKEGRLIGMDFSPYDEIIFYAKASSELLLINEVNLFIGPNHIQYINSSRNDLLLSTNWTEYRLSFQDFKIAPWELKYRSHMIDKGFINTPKIANVTGLGIDLKTDSKVLSGRIWVDFIRLRGNKGAEILLSDGSNIDFQFLKHPLRWVAGARAYP